MEQETQSLLGADSGGGEGGRGGGVVVAYCSPPDINVVLTDQLSHLIALSLP